MPWKIRAVYDGKEHWHRRWMNNRVWNRTMTTTIQWLPSHLLLPMTTTIHSTATRRRTDKTTMVYKRNAKHCPRQNSHSNRNWSRPFCLRRDATDTTRDPNHPNDDLCRHGDDGNNAKSNSNNNNKKLTKVRPDRAVPVWIRHPAICTKMARAFGNCFRPTDKNDCGIDASPENDSVSRVARRLLRKTRLMQWILDADNNHPRHDSLNAWIGHANKIVVGQTI